LVTATFIAITALAARAGPSPLRAIQLAGVMLPIQFCIGITNDLADRRGDAAGKPYKPLVRGLVNVRLAALAAGFLAALGLATAATVNVPTLALAAGGLGAGLAYDLGLGRTAFSWLPWWAGIASLPLTAFAAAGALSVRLLVLLPLSGLIAVGLHLANAVPDVDDDRRAGRVSLAVLVGERWSRRLALAGIAAAGFLALAAAWPLGQAGVWLPMAVGLLSVALVAVLVVRPRRPFPVLAVATAIFAVSWLATLPMR
jgi:4-hydroxybenzoate polyprenyltransferase